MGKKKPNNFTYNTSLWGAELLKKNPIIRREVYNIVVSHE